MRATEMLATAANGCRIKYEVYVCVVFICPVHRFQSLICVLGRINNGRH